MDNITIENLNDPIFINKLDEKVNKIEFFNNTKEALYLSRDLEKLLFNNEKSIKDKEISEILKVIIARLKFILFNTLDENEIIDIFNKYLTIGIKMAYLDLGEILKIRVSLIPINKRDEFKEKLKKIILNNQEEITEKLIIDNQTKNRPTISAWLRLYNKKLGTEVINSLEQNKFYINDSNFSRLSDLEKLEVKELFSIYEYLKRSSMTIEGNEDDMIVTDVDGKDYWFKDGRFIKLDKTVNSNIENQTVIINKAINVNQDKEDLKKIASKYPPGSLEHKVIEEEIDRITRST